MIKNDGVSYHYEKVRRITDINLLIWMYYLDLIISYGNDKELLKICGA